MNDPHIAIGWEGLPVYGARLVAAGRRSLGGLSVTVLGTRPSVPLEGIESELGQSVIWLSRERCTTWRELGLRIPTVFIHTGWAYPYFNALGEEVRRAGGRVIAMVDNRWKANLRQCIGALVFRLKLRRRYSALWVPGVSGYRLARFLGMPAAQISMGMYGADPLLFPPGAPLSGRAKRVVFVGQYIARKGIDLLSSAWGRVHEQYPDWELVCYGSGPEEDRLRRTPNCRVLPFLQPAEIAAAMREARFLVLPSRDDHWGLVVHEASLSGCGLIVSDAVGAGLDLVGEANGMICEAGNIESLVRALFWACTQNGERLGTIYDESLQKARQFGPEVWATRFVALTVEAASKN